MQAGRVFKWVGLGVMGIAVIVLLFVGMQVMRFNMSTGSVYDVAPLDMAASSDSVVLARGEHLARSFGGCVGCHGLDLGGGLAEDFGPVGTMIPPNLTSGVGGVGGNYTDGELARAIKHGLDEEGRTLLFMPTREHNWWPESDVQAVMSYVRSVPPVDRETPPSTAGTLGKILSQFGVMELRSAQGINHTMSDVAPDPEPTARYGAFIARSCEGCHGDGFAGGKIPGAPSDLAIPANLTLHETGLAGWDFVAFDNAMRDGISRDGSELDSFMPRWAGMNEVEMRALWEYLKSLTPTEFGAR